MQGITTKLTDGFVQAAMLQIACGSGSNSVDLPEGTKTFVVTNPEKMAGAWISFGAAGADLKAVVGVDHHLAGGNRLIVQKTPGVSKVAAIGDQSKRSENLVIYVECGDGGLTENEVFRLHKDPACGGRPAKTASDKSASVRNNTDRRRPVSGGRGRQPFRS